MKRFKDYIFENKLIFKKPKLEPVLEGGNAIKISRGIRQDEVNATLEDIKKNLFKKYFLVYFFSERALERYLRGSP